MGNRGPLIWISSRKLSDVIAPIGTDVFLNSSRRRQIK
jgi:hypothetical protein